VATPHSGVDRPGVRARRGRACRRSPTLARPARAARSLDLLTHILCCKPPSRSMGREVFAAGCHPGKTSKKRLCRPPRPCFSYSLTGEPAADWRKLTIISNCAARGWACTEAAHRQDVDDSTRQKEPRKATSARFAASPRQYLCAPWDARKAIEKRSNPS
jgi:hypothetical protein